VSTTRRRFLQSTLGSSALVALGYDVPGFLARTALAAASDGGGERVLVVVQLSGGNDGLNTVVPFNDPAYAAARPQLAIPASQVVTVNDRIGLHPALAGFGKLLEARRLAIVQGVGYPNPDRSHFRSMDIWHSARPDLATPTDGWLGRSVECLDGAVGRDVPALHLGAEQLPLALVSGRVPVPSVATLDNFRLRTESGALPPEALAQLASTAAPGEPPLADFLRRTTLAAYQSSTQVQAALQEESSPVEYPGLGLAQKLRSIAGLIDAQLATRIYYVSLDGFDTHANQAAAHAALLGELGSSLAAFYEDLAHRGQADRVLTLTFSEFGRRLAENASAGTDHGAAAPMFLAGSGLAGPVVGEHPSLTDLDDGDPRFHTDFRQVYAAVLQSWLGCDPATVLGGQFEPAKVLS
jgi:uncharacterized protein (DUF1501 family)